MFLIFTKFINYHEWSDEEMKWKLKNLAALAMSAAMVLSMAACGSDSGSTSTAASAAGSAAGSEAAATASGDQNLNILLSGTVNNLDPNASSWTGEYQIVTQSQASLLRIVTDDSDKDTYVEDGCESYEVSD